MWTELLLCALVGAQSDLDDKFERLQRQNAELQLRSEALQLSFGSNEPWMPADPQYSTRDELVAALNAAPALVARDWALAQERWDVSIRWNETAKTLLGGGMNGVWGDVVGALHRNGRGTDPDGAVCVDLGLVVLPGRLGPADPSGRDGYVVEVDARLLVPARRFDGERVTCAPVALGAAVALRVASGAPERAVVQETLFEAVRSLIEGLPQDAAHPDERLASWLSSDAADDARWKAFASARADRPEELRPEQLALTALARVDVVEASTQRSFAAQRERWIESLARRGLRVDSRAIAGDLDLALVQRAHTAVGSDGFAAVAVRTSMARRGVLVRHGEGYGWLDGELWQELSVQGYDAERIAHWTTRSLEEQREKLVAQLSVDLARVAAAPHPDAELVARYLRKRQLLDVPPHALAPIANRIANALAPPERGWLDPAWIVGAGDERFAYLGYVGLARAKRPEVRRIVEELTLQDPLGLWAFDNLWQLDPNPPRYRPVLPPAFAKRFDGPRPSGPGALCGVRLESFDEVVWRKAQGIDPLAVRNQTIDRCRKQLVGRALPQVLSCQFIPLNGAMNFVERRSFWHLEQPADWSSLRAQLPPELGLHSIGPPLPDGPDTLSEAERLLASVR